MLIPSRTSRWSTPLPTSLICSAQGWKTRTATCVPVGHAAKSPAIQPRIVSSPARFRSFLTNLPGGSSNCKLRPANSGGGNMLSESENRLMTQVGPGTPGGEMLRRYWWPIEFSDHVKDRPMKVRLLGQDFVLFRNGQGKVGMLDLHCPHRLTSLEYGRVE